MEFEICLASGRRRAPALGRAPEAGFSLIEALVAIGIAGALLVSVGGLFVAGSRSVRSGRELTRAVVLAKSALEDVEGWPYLRLSAQAGASDTDTTASWTTDDANPTFGGGPEDIARMAATADDWRQRVQTELPQGVLIYEVDGLRGFPTESSDGLAPFQAARMSRVGITVSWVEPGGRARSVVIERLLQ